MPNVNIHETEKTDTSAEEKKTTSQEKNDGYGCTREEKGGLDGDGLIDKTREDMKKYELT